MAEKKRPGGSRSRRELVDDVGLDRPGWRCTAPQPEVLPESEDSMGGNLTESPKFNIEITEDSGLTESPMESRRALGDSLIGLSRWWIVDLFIALFIYYMARRFLV